MRNTNFTPGPLDYSLSGDIFKDDKIIGSAYVLTGDAHLWAAAPELLEALELLVAGCIDDKRQTTYAPSMSRIEKALLAIKKATE